MTDALQSATTFEYVRRSSTSDASQAIQKIGSVVNSIKQQGFEVKELEVDTEKEE